MTFALTSFAAYGVERDEGLTNLFHQYARFTITAANTDVDLDLGDYSGTFWTAVGGTAPGITALQAMKNINIRALTFLHVAGNAIAGKVQADASYTSIVALDSTGTTGGAATEAVTVTGLATTDTILAVSQKVKGANSTALNGFNTQITNGLTLSWTANPGANSVSTVLVSRQVTAVQAGTYQLAMDATNVNLPNILFVTGDAPTALVIELEWLLKNNETPVFVTAP